MVRSPKAVISFMAPPGTVRQAPTSVPGVSLGGPGSPDRGTRNSTLWSAARAMAGGPLRADTYISARKERAETARGTRHVCHLRPHCPP